MAQPVLKMPMIHPFCQQQFFQLRGGGHSRPTALHLCGSSESLSAMGCLFHEFLRLQRASNLRQVLYIHISFNNSRSWCITPIIINVCIYIHIYICIYNIYNIYIYMLLKYIYIYIYHIWYMIYYKVYIIYNI